MQGIENTQKIHAVVVRGRFLDRRALNELLRVSEEAAQKN